MSPIHFNNFSSDPMLENDNSHVDSLLLCRSLSSSLLPLQPHFVTYHFLCVFMSVPQAVEEVRAKQASTPMIGDGEPRMTRDCRCLVPRGSVVRSAYIS